MDAKVVVVLALVLTALCLSDGEYARLRRLSRLWAPGCGFLRGLGSCACALATLSELSLLYFA